MKAGSLPVAFASTVLLGLLGILTSMAMFGKEAREMLLGRGSAISKTLVVLVVELVGTSHWKGVAALVIASPTQAK